MATITDLHKLLQWFSPGYPVGAFAYSHGLEAVISEGGITDAAGLKHWLRDILRHGAGRNDAIFLVAAYRGVKDVRELSLAYNPSAERRLETTAQGAAFWRLTQGGHEKGLTYPVAVGYAAKAQGLPLPETVAAYLHGFCANLVSAAVRFVPLGQTEGQAVLAGLFATIDVVCEAALEASLEDLGGYAFRADMASMQHETLKTRIFRT